MSPDLDPVHSILGYTIVRVRERGNSAVLKTALLLIWLTSSIVTAVVYWTLALKAAARRRRAQ